MKATTGSKAVYYSRGFELISRQEGSEASYYLYDGGLSVRALTNEAGTVTDTLVFDDFGNETTKTGRSDNSYGFQGEERDETGLYYLRARYMDPLTGTFTSMDTYGGSLSDPMSLHKYMFANSNPVMNCDPSGHYTLTEQQTTVAIQAILGEATSGIFYIVDMVITDPEMENHSVGGLLFAMLMGFMLGACGGYAQVSASAWAFKMILGAFGITFGTLGIFKGLEDFENGYSIYGVIEVALSIIMITSGLSGIRSGWSEKGEYTGLGYTPNKRGYLYIGGRNSNSVPNDESGYGNYKFKEGVDTDLRGKGTHKDALEIAFEKTGLSKEQFEITKWGKDKYGKSFPVEWRAKNGAEVNIDAGHAPDGNAPSIPHVGWQTGGKRGNGGGLRGHVFVDDVPYYRGS